METKHFISKKSEVKHIMTRHLFVLNLKDSITKAKKMFDEFHIRHLPVVAGSKVVGMLSLNDVLRMSFGDDFFEADRATTLFESLTLEDVMRKNPHTVDENESIETVARKLRDEAFHALPVVNEDGIVGIITTTDLIDFFLEGVGSDYNIEKNL